MTTEPKEYWAIPTYRTEIFKTGQNDKCQATSSTTTHELRVT